MDFAEVRRTNRALVKVAKLYRGSQARRPADTAAAGLDPTARGRLVELLEHVQANLREPRDRRP
ncbi:MAG: hypothetical protein DLM59_20455 [Pseudonocardiales bacterium]|nr:MAG: hypothetical protein DLM59_20455 [Pseudonocardiales bacterium]